jgi:hypothetical protein
MTRVFLAAGVAALAIAAPAVAGPHGNHGGGAGGGGQPAFDNRGGGGGHGGGGFAAPREQRQSAPRFEQRQQRMSMPRMERPQRAERFAMERPQRSQHVEMRQQRAERAQPRMAARNEMRASQQHMASRQQTRENRLQTQNRHARANRVEQAQNRQQLRSRVQQAQNHEQVRVERNQQAQAMHSGRMNGQNRMAMRQQLQNNRLNAAQDRPPMRQQVEANRHQGAQNLLAERHALRADRIANADAFRTSRFASMVDTPRTRFIAPAEAVRFVGQPVNRVNDFVALSALPSSVSYLYPATPNYYYQYGDGYLYQVDRSTSIVDALIPLLAGGFLPGTYLPQPYMASYVPSYYGLNSWYPSSYADGYPAGYGGYGYGYPNLCNRYAYGTVYQVDCLTGMVVNVIPTYAGGYGVGQMLPSAYSYYNLPMQYRSMYYPTADYSYWYAPGAIYQYDTRSSLITSVAALMSPGFTVGQPLPAGYDMYNVPMSYRATYYDTPNAWYRYNNGYIYQVDPSTMLVTSIVASLLT